MLFIILCMPWLVPLIFMLFQTRQIRSLWGQSRRASSQCVLMLQCHACQMRCTLTRWPLKCSMVEAVAGTVGTAGLTKHCRYIIWSVNPVHVHRVDRNPDIYPNSFLYFPVHNRGGRIVWTHLWTCSSWGTSCCFPGGPCCWLYVRIQPISW